MNKVNLSREFELKETRILLKEILQDIPKKNRFMNKQECYVTYDNNEELDIIATAFATVLTETKIVDYLYNYCEFQKMTEDKIPPFVEAFFMSNTGFVSYALILTKIKLITYFKFNDELNIESFIMFNMNLLNKDIDKLMCNATVLESIYTITDSGVIEMIDVLQDIVDIEEKIKDKPRETFKDFKIYYDNGLKCITESKVFIDEKYFKENFNIEFDEDLNDASKIFSLISLLKPNRVILFASVPEEVRDSLINSGKTFEPIIGAIKFMTATEKKPVN